MPDLLTNLQQQANDERRRSEETTNRYAAILRKLRSGEPADSELLAAAAPLGLSETDLQNFAEVLRQEADLLAAAAAMPELEKKVETACRAYEDERAKQKRIAEEPVLRLLRLGAVVRENSGELAEAREAGRRLSNLYEKNWRLFGIPEPPQPKEAGANMLFGRRPEPEAPRQDLRNCYYQPIAIAPTE